MKDQGLVGACTAFSLSTAMDNAIKRLNQNDATSSLHVWSHYGDPEMDAAGSGNLNRTIALWADYPYDQGTACRMDKDDDGCGQLVTPNVQENSAASDPVIQAQVRAADSKGRYKVTEIDQLDPIDPDVLATDLATGKDVWIALGVSTDAWTSANVQSTFVIPEYAGEDGGHAVVFAGYRTTATGRQFLVHNSWSERWGDKGYAWISEATVRAHAQVAYTIKVVDTGAPPPPPTPIPTPAGTCAEGQSLSPTLGLCEKTCKVTSECGAGNVCVTVDPAPAPSVCVSANPSTDDDCGENELVDAVTGLCGPMCPDGTRSAASKCDAATARFRR